QSETKATDLTWTETELVFAKNRLSERRSIEMPSGKVLAQESYDSDGTVKYTGADGKSVSMRKLNVSATEAADLSPDTKNLVVLPLPYRTPQQVFQAFELKDWNFGNYKDEAALAMFAAQLWQNPWQAQNLYHQRFYTRNIRSLGFYTLLASAGIPMGNN